MSILNELVSQIEDANLRTRIAQEVEKLAKQKKFGLVFEEHLPECTPLYDMPIRVGSRVAKKDVKITDIYNVISVNNGIAMCLNKDTKETTEFPVDDLVIVAEFGEPIYPYLKPLDSVCNAPDSDLWHTLIEADNYHALQLLEYLYAGKVDCIYIDPPYNTGAKDWKYNNDYVDGVDQYRHSKWLSMMQKRLKIAKKLLSEDGVLITTIDDNELANLILLLKEVFPDRKHCDVHIQHNPRGTQSDFFAVTHETAIFSVSKKSKIFRRIHDSDDVSSFRKWGNQSERSIEERATTFYSVIVDNNSLEIVGFGDVLPLSSHPKANETADELVYVYPVDKNDIERKWRYSRENAEAVQPFLKAIRGRNGRIEIVIGRATENTKTIWTDGAYNAEIHGTKLVNKILNRSFPFPKSLYAVKDCLWHIISGKPNALVLDFFAGSGTTLHAVNLLNAEDGGNRRCIIVTNNEVSVEETNSLSNKGFHPGDEEWERLGIARYVTWPRTVCSIEGHDIKGNPLKGNYLGSELLMSNGFKSNATFFKLGFLDKNSVALGKQFRELLPVLWMKAGAKGECPSIQGELPKYLILEKNKFAVLINEQAYMEFVDALDKTNDIETVYIVTDSEAGYRSMIANINVENTYQLYRDYLDNFRINSVRR